MGNKKTILIIDDEPDLVKLLEVRLGRNNYNVLSAHTAESGLEIASQSNPDLIILDINLPGMGGIEFYNKVCDETGHARYPILVVTGRGELQNFFEEIKVDGFIAKPFETPKLLKEINRIMLKNSPPIEPGKPKLNVYLIDVRGDIHPQEIQDALEKENYNVFMVEGLDMFAWKARKNKPDIIFVEYMQTDIEGDKFIGELKNAPHTYNVPIIVYSYSGLDYKDKSLKAGADKYIGKPAKYSEFINVIKEFSKGEK